MEKFLNELKNTKGTNNKKEIIGKQPSHIRQLLYLCYNPFMMSNIKKVPKIKEFGDRSCRQALDEFTVLFTSLVHRSLSGMCAKNAVEAFLKGCTKEAAEVFTLVLQKDLKAGIAASTINDVFPNLIPTFDVQLANKYDPKKKYKSANKKPVEDWWANKKLDGLRGFSEENDSEIRSRKGHPFAGFNHIVEELNTLKEDYGFTFVDGELYNHDIPFQTIQSIIRKGDEDDIDQELLKAKKKIKFNIFACGHKRGYLATVDMVNELAGVDWSEFKYLVPVDYFKIKNDPDTIYEKMMELSTLGFEGIMLRDPVTPYERKRSNALLKYKPFFEEDFTVVECLPGEADGRFSNTLGAVVVEGVLRFAGEVRKVRTEIGSGWLEWDNQADDDGNHQPNKTNWNGGDWGPLPVPTREWVWTNRECLKGCQMEVSFQGFSDTPQEDGTWKLKFATVNKLKLDR